MLRFDSLVTKLKADLDESERNFALEIFFHTIGIVACLSSSDEQTSKESQAFLNDVFLQENTSSLVFSTYLYDDIKEHNQNYFSSGQVPEFFARIIKIDEKALQKELYSDKNPLSLDILKAVIDWFESLGNTYIEIFGMMSQQCQAFYDYISRLHNYYNDFLVLNNGTGGYDNRVEKNSVEKNSAEIAQSFNAQSELESLIGLSDIKHDVDELISLAKMNKMRVDKGLKCIPLSLHLVFTGNPGTGKTTVARILAKLYNEIGILSRGQLIEVDRADLVAGYVGQTAIKTAEKIKEALGGILFIDEAYTLAKDGNDFGQEAIDTLLKAMEDNRDDFIVIVAGYQAPMEKFINSNPGLKSRFNKFFLFPDYSSDELSVIFRQICKKYDYSVSDDVLALVDQHIASIVATKTDNFANAREIRNYFERIVANQALRLSKLNDVSQTDLYTITVDDLE